MASILLPIHSYELRSIPASSARLVNCYPEQLPPDAKTPVILTRANGVKTWTTVGSGPIRGMYAAFIGLTTGGIENLYVVSGSELYFVDTAKVVTLIGNIGSPNNIDLDSNTTHIVVVNEPNGFHWDGTTFAQITDEDFVSRGAGDVEFLDNFLLFRQPDSGVFFGADLGSVTDFDGQQSSDTCIVNVTWQNIPPIADAGPNQEVNAGELVTLDGNNSYDLDGTITSYLWTQLSGTTVILSNNSTVQPIFVSPNFGPEGESLTFQLTVTDDGGLQSKDTCIVNIIGLNSPPVANAGPNQEVNEGELVTLDGNNSYDSDGTIASYLWTQLSGTNVTLSNVTAAQPTFTSLNVGPEGESLTFRLTVTDDGELQSTDTCIINIIGLNSPPVANAGPDQAINEGVLVTLDGNGSYDKDGTITSYSWTQLSGPPIELSDNIVVKPSFTSPNVGTEGESLTFQLNVTDDGGLLNSDKVSIEISDVDGEDEGDGGGAFCFIATASFGSPMEKEVEILRRFRDRYLYTNKPGKAFTALYYKHSPRIAEYIDDKDSIKAFMRIGLYPAIGFSYFMVETKLLHKLITMILLTLTSGAIIVLVKKWRRNITIQSKTGRSK